jgi:hypothetical protein
LYKAKGKLMREKWRKLLRERWLQFMVWTIPIVILAHMWLTIDLWGAFAFAAALGLAAWKGKRGMRWACLFGFVYPLVATITYFVEDWIIEGHIVGLTEAEASLTEAGARMKEWAIIWPISGALMAAVGLVGAICGGLIGLLLRPIALRKISN